ncbi:hypothetical protein Tco_0491760 [Tanacetum coccineum]
MASVAPRYHGGDAGGDLPERPNKPLPHQYEGGFSFTPPPLPTLVPETVSTLIFDPYFDPNRYYQVMNPGSSCIPNDDGYGDDKDGNDEDGDGNNEPSSSDNE